MTKFKFFLKEALESLWRTRLRTIVTVTTIAISLFLVGGFYLSLANVENFIHTLKDDFQIIVYVRESVDENSVALEVEQIKKWPQVKSAEFINSDQAKKILAAELQGEDLQLEMADLSSFNLPGAIKILVNEVRDLQVVAERFKEFSYVEDVAYGQGMVNNIRGVITLFSGLSFSCILLLGFACLCIVANTIKLNILHRLDEIEVMKLVGATPWFIRWPFLIEGSLQGFLGAFLALATITLAYPLFLSQLKGIVPFIPVITSGAFLLKGALKLIIFGTLLGSMGSLFSLKKLKTI